LPLRARSGGRGGRHARGAAATIRLLGRLVPPLAPLQAAFTVALMIPGAEYLLVHHGE